MREKTKATPTVASAQGPKQGARGSARSSAGTKANSTVRRSNLEPYHDIATAVFTVNDTKEMEEMFVLAAKEGDFSKVEALLRRRNEIAFSIDIRDTETGNTAIIWAAMRGHFKIVELLVKHGADITLRNYDGQTAIEVASPQIRSQLLEAVDRGGPHRNLLQAAWQGNAKLVNQILMENTVDINCRNSEGLTPLLLVTRDVQLFEKLGDKINKSYNPLEVVTQLLAHRADPNVTDEDGKTPLHYVSASKASQSGDLAKILLADGAETESRDKRNFMPIHCAAQSGNADVVIALLDGGSECNSRGFAGTTPLHISAINGHNLVVATLLLRGADVTKVDDSGLTSVDVAKTKKVKATLKEAWTEATLDKTGNDLGPVRTPTGDGLSRGSQSNVVSGIAQNRGKKGGGEVIFDSLPTTTPVNGPSSEVIERTNDITPRRASTIASIERHLSSTDKARRAEDQMYKDMAAGQYRGRTPTTTPKSPSAGRRLSPIKNQVTPRKYRAGIKFGPGTKLHDGSVTESQVPPSGQWKPGLKKCLSDPTRYNGCTTQIPVTVLGLDLDDNLQEVKVKHLLQGAAVQSMVGRTAQHIRQNSDPYAPSPVVGESSAMYEDMYYRGRCPSKSSITTICDDYDESFTPKSTSPPRLTPIRTPSVSDRNRGLRMSTNRDRVPSASQGSSPAMQSRSLYMHSRKVLPPTSTYLTEPPPEGSDIKMLDCSMEFNSKESSPRSDEGSTAGHVQLAVNDPSALLNVQSVLRGGNFNIEKTRIRNSDDSGLPEDKGSSKSSSVSSSVSTFSSGSPGPPESQILQEKSLTSRTNNTENMRQSQKNEGGNTRESSDLHKSQSEPNFTGKPVAKVVPPSGTGGNQVGVSAGAKLRQVSKENAAVAQPKVEQTDAPPKPPPRRNRVTVHSTALGPSNPNNDKSVSGNSSKLYSNFKQGQVSVSSNSKENQPTSQAVKNVTTVTHIQLNATKSSADSKVDKNTNSSEKPVDSKIARSNKSQTAKTENNSPKTPGVNKPVGSNTKVAQNSGAKTDTKSKPDVPIRPQSLAQNTNGLRKSQNQDSVTASTSNNNVRTQNGSVPSQTKGQTNGTKLSQKSVTANQHSLVKTEVKVSEACNSNKANSNVSVSKSNKSISAQVSTEKPGRKGSLTTTNVTVGQKVPGSQDNVKCQENNNGIKNNTVVKSGNGQSKPSTPPTRPPPPNSLDVSKVASVEQVDVPVARITFNSKSIKNTVAGTRDMSGSGSQLTPVSSTNFIPSLDATPTKSNDGSPCEHTEPAIPTITQIQVKPYQRDPTVPPEGPVITNPFEALLKEREAALNSEPQNVPKPREKSALKQKQVPKKSSRAPDSRATSANKRGNKSNRGAANETPVRPPRQKNKKTKTKKKKKKGPDDLMLTDRPGDPSSSAFISGKGWYIHTGCADSSDVQAVHITNDSSDSDEDDTTYVQPNYDFSPSDDGEDFIGTSVRLSTESVRKSWEKKNSSSIIPGQIASDSSDDADEEVFDEAEDVQVEVVFTIGSNDDDDSPGTTARDLTNRQDTQSVFKSVDKKPLLQTVEVRGINDKVTDRNKSPSAIAKTEEAIEVFSRGLTNVDLNDLLGDDSESPRVTQVSTKDLIEETALDIGKLDSDIEQEKLKLIKDMDVSDNKKTANAEIPKSNFESPEKLSDTVQNENIQNRVIRHSEGFRAPKNEVSKPLKKKEPSSKENEDDEIECMIDEILKSTPNPSLTLSWRSLSESSSSKKNSNGMSSVTKEELRKHLAQFQNDTNQSFKEVKNDANEDTNPDQLGWNGELENEDIICLQKVVDSYKDMALKVDTDTSKHKAQEPPIQGKPPKPPRAVNAAKQEAIIPLKSPRFVRKHDSHKGKKVIEILSAKDSEGSVMGSEFGTGTLPGVEDRDSLVPSDRAETVTSRIGRRNSTSMEGSVMTNTSEDVETIQWKRGNLLGKGAYGKVWCGLTNAGELIAVKQMELNVDNMEKAEKEYEKIQEEVELLKTLKHQNIVGYLGTSLEDNVVSIFMQFVPGGSIYNLITRFGALEEEVFCRYTKQILEGVDYLHGNNVIHRDIKGGNIMLMHNGVIKLIDFGCAKRLYINMSPSMSSSSQKHLLKSMRGTPYWMAPEVVREEGHGTKSDIWSIGCTVFEMATMKPPWADVAPYAAIFSIGNDSRPVPKLPTKFSSEAQDFVKACLTRDQHKRPSASEMLQHSFILKRQKKSGSFS